MAIEDNKTVVRRYFEEVIDARNGDLLGELFSEDCVVYRPDQTGPLVGIESFRKFLFGGSRILSDLKTKIHAMIQEGDRVAVHITHNAVFRDKFPSRIGVFDCTGKPTTWEAMAIFVFKEGKIIEEYVVRDELGMFSSAGAVQGMSQ